MPSRPEAVSVATPAQWLAVGNGWQVYQARFAPDIAAIPRAPLLHPHAIDVARLGAALHRRGESVGVARRCRFICVGRSTSLLPRRREAIRTPGFQLRAPPWGLPKRCATHHKRAAFPRFLSAFLTSPASSPDLSSNPLVLRIYTQFVPVCGPLMTKNTLLSLLQFS